MISFIYVACFLFYLTTYFSFITVISIEIIYIEYVNPPGR